MKRFLLLLFFLLSLNICKSQSLSILISEAQKLEASFDEKNAFNKYKEALKLQSNNEFILTKCSELCSSIGNRETTTKSRDIYFNTALYYAQTAIKQYPESDLSNVAMAIAVGRIVLTKSGKEKIASVKDLKEYAEKAIKTNPNNFKAWHILGKWYYEVSNLSSFERGAAKLFFGALPSASFSNAILCYEKAKTLSPTFILNYLELAKVYKKTGEIEKAKTALKSLILIPNNAADDSKIKEEAKLLLAKL